jgi:hypothetical protein
MIRASAALVFALPRCFSLDALVLPCDASRKCREMRQQIYTKWDLERTHMDIL